MSLRIKSLLLFLAFAAVALLAVLTLTDRGAPTGDAGPEPVRLDRGIGPEPESLDPHVASTVQAHIVLHDLFEGLLKFRPDGSVKAGVAHSWEVSDDGLTYRFRLREDARWSNGDPVTADDFVAGFRRLVDPATASTYADTLKPVVNATAITAGQQPVSALGVEANGPYELTISLESATPYFLSLLALPQTSPVNRGALVDPAEKPVSNGAYRLHDWSLGSFIEIHRNEHYWDNAATSIDVVRHHVTAEPSSELFRYLAGELDITHVIPAEDFARLLEERPDEVRVGSRLAVYYYGMNLRHPDLGSQPALREALSLAIDRELIAEKVVGRGELPAYSFVPDVVDNYDPPRLRFADWTADERIAEARRLYEEAGFGPNNPLEIELRYNTSETHERVALAVQDMWRKTLGFEATLINEDLKVLIKHLQAGDITEIFRLNWTGDFNDPYAFLAMFRTGHPMNFYAYSSDDFDTQLERAAEQTDAGRRKLYNEEAERALLNDHVVMPIYFLVNKHLVSPRVKGWQDNPLDVHYSQDLRIDDDE